MPQAEASTEVHQAEMPQSAERAANTSSSLQVSNPAAPSHKKVIIISVIGTVILLPLIVFGSIFAFAFVKELQKNKVTKPVSTVFISEEKDFQATFPGVPVRASDPLSMGGGLDPVPSITYEANLKKGTFLIMVANYPKPDYDFSVADPKKVLDATIEAAGEGSKIETTSYGDVQGFPSEEALYTKDTIVSHHKVFMADNTLYQMIVTQEESKKDDSYKAFFDSFKYIGTTTPSTTKNMKDQTSQGIYTKDEMRAILLGTDKDSIKKVVDSVLINPNSVYQMDLFLVAYQLFTTLGNKEQGVFWYYVAQSRTRAYAKADPDQSAARAFRTALMNQVGPSINEWAGSDILAWQALAERAISYEKKLVDPEKPKYVLSDADWKAFVDKERAGYEADFKKEFTTQMLSRKTEFEAVRKKNGVPVGPWTDRGEPLLDSWK